jgi:hypothetical protein
MSASTSGPVRIVHRIVTTRIRWDERTQVYPQRRTAEGMSKREIIRCLKRYVAREFYRHVRPSVPLNCPPPLDETVSLHLAGPGPAGRVDALAAANTAEIVYTPTNSSD